MAAVLWIEPEHLPFGPDDVRPQLAPDIEHLQDPDAQDFDVAVIPGSTGAALRNARFLHERAPRSHLIFVAPPARIPELKNQLLLAPRIGRHWAVLDGSDPAAAAEAIAQAVRAAAGRRQLRTTLRRMNVRLDRDNDPVRLRRMAISDRFLASLLDHASDPILAIDLDGRVETANRAAVSFFGFDPRGSNLAEHLEDVGAQKLDAAVASRSAARFQSSLAGSDGRVVELSISTVYDTGGSAIGFSAIVRDMTAEQRTQRIADFLHRASEILFSSLEWQATFERAANAAVPFLGELCVIDIMEEGQLIRKTVATSRPDLLGPGSKRLGQAIELHPEHPAARAMATGEPLATVIEETFWSAVAPKEPASSKPAKASLNLPLRIRGRIEGAISFLSWERQYDPIDVTTGLEFARRAALALENARLYHEVASANRSKDEFLATLSHELRTPMTSILGWSRLLEMDAVNPDLVMEAATAIRRSAETQAQLIDDLLDVSRIAAGKLRLDVDTISVAAVVDAAVDTVRPAAEARGVEIVRALDPELHIRGDAARLQQVVWNLLSNAVKFTPRGGKVTATAVRSGSDARIEVSDTGEGIPQEFLPHLFQRFRQLESGTRRSMGGLGLGLAIARHLVELHGGTISATSEGEGKGATFTILLPIAAALEALPAGEVPSNARPRAHAGAMPDLGGANLLVLEDDAESRRVIETILRSAGAEVRLAASVAEAMHELEIARPDLVISDIAMPGEDGYVFIGRLRERGDSITVIALTAFGQPDERERILAAGFDHYLMKPIDPVALASAVAEMLARTG